MSLINAQHSHLLVVDIQEKLGAVMPSKVINRVISNTMLLLRVAGLMEVPITCTEQYPAGLGVTMSEIANLFPESARTIEKTSFSAWNTAEFQECLDSSSQERDQIIVCGMEAHVCVLQTAIDLRQAGRRVVVVEDAICSRKLENYQNALERLRQEDVTIVSAESVMFEWLGDSNHPHFRAVSALIR